MNPERLGCAGSRYPVNERKRSLRDIAAELEARGHLNERGKRSPRPRSRRCWRREENLADAGVVRKKDQPCLTLDELWSMGSSSQSLDFSFDALRDFGSRLFRDRPNEARIFQHDVMRCVFERQSGEPAPVHQGPGRPVIMTAMAQQKAGELLARLPQHAHRRQSRAHQIADRLMGWIWNPHRRQFTRSVQFGQVNRVASVGFDPIAGLARNQRRGDYDAFVPGFAQLALNAVTARAGLIAKSKAPAVMPAWPPASSTPPACSRSCHTRAAPPLARLGKRHRDCVFVHIQADVDDTLLHDPSPMHEARRWSIQRNPRQPAYCETGRPISGEHLV